MSHIYVKIIYIYIYIKIYPLPSENKKASLTFKLHLTHWNDLANRPRNLNDQRNTSARSDYAATLDAHLRFSTYFLIEASWSHNNQ